MYPIWVKAELLRCNGDIYGIVGDHGIVASNSWYNLSPEIAFIKVQDKGKQTITFYFKIGKLNKITYTLRISRIRFDSNYENFNRKSEIVGVALIQIAVNSNLERRFLQEFSSSAEYHMFYDSAIILAKSNFMYLPFILLPKSKWSQDLDLYKDNIFRIIDMTISDIVLPTSIFLLKKDYLSQLCRRENRINAMAGKLLMLIPEPFKSSFVLLPRKKWENLIETFTAIYEFTLNTNLDPNIKLIKHEKFNRNSLEEEFMYADIHARVLKEGESDRVEYLKLCGVLIAIVALIVNIIVNMFD